VTGDIFSESQSFQAGQSVPDSVQEIGRSPDLVIAASAEIHGEHLIFLRSDGSPAALFVLEIVQSLSEFEAQSA
jgi:hypothetical protein